MVTHVKIQIFENDATMGFFLSLNEKFIRSKVTMMLLDESKTFLLIIRGIRLTQKVIAVTWTVYGAAQKSSFETIDSMGLFLAKGSYDGRSLAEQFPTL